MTIYRCEKCDHPARDFRICRYCMDKEMTKEAVMSNKIYKNFEEWYLEFEKVNGIYPYPHKNLMQLTWDVRQAEVDFLENSLSNEEDSEERYVEVSRKAYGARQAEVDDLKLTIDAKHVVIDTLHDEIENLTELIEILREDVENYKKLAFIISNNKGTP